MFPGHCWHCIALNAGPINVITLHLNTYAMLNMLNDPLLHSTKHLCIFPRVLLENRQLYIFVTSILSDFLFEIVCIFFYCIFFLFGSDFSYFCFVHPFS